MTRLFACLTLCTFGSMAYAGCDLGSTEIGASAETGDPMPTGSTGGATDATAGTVDGTASATDGMPTADGPTEGTDTDDGIEYCSEFGECTMAGDFCIDGTLCEPVEWLPQCDPPPILTPILTEDQGALVGLLRFINANDDGADDLVVVRQVGTQLVLGNGGSPLDIPLPPEEPVTDLTSGDLDDDGDEDLIVILGQMEIVTMLNDGNGAFSTGTITFPMADTQAVQALRWNSDAFVDVIVLSESFGTIDLYRGDGVGGWIPPLSQEFGLNGMVAGRFDLDDHDDLAAFHTDSLLLFQGGDDEELDPALVIPDLVHFNQARTLLAGDVDGNGTDELIAYTGAANDWTLLEVWRDGIEIQSLHAVHGRMANAVIGDYDGDMTPDVIMSNGVDDSVVFVRGLLRGPDAPVFECQVEVPVDMVGSRLAVGDHDGDGGLDIAISEGTQLQVLAVN